MKRRFSLFLAVMVVMGGCAVSSEQSNDESQKLQNEITALQLQIEELNFDYQSLFNELNDKNTEIEQLRIKIQHFEEKNVKLDDITAVYNGKEYKSLEDFLCSKEGLLFQVTAYRAAQAFYAGDVEELKKYYFSDAFAEDYQSMSSDNKHEIYSMVIRMSLDDIGSYGIGITYICSVIYEGKISGNQYLGIFLALDENEQWKIRLMSLEG